MTQDASVRVLLVEDNPGDARLVEILLSEVGTTSFEITHAERLSEALEHLSRSEYDVILLDLSLPDSSGVETVDQMRAAVHHMPVVVLSGQDDEDTALRAIQGGAEDYLLKGHGDGGLIARSIRYSIERKRSEERLAYMAQYDHLTGLTNRALFQDRLEQALARAKRSGALVALMFLDLDRFKAVNDTLGHGTGDLLLKKVAERLEGSVRETDTVARIGGDEFSIILEGLTEAQDAALVARKIIDKLVQPFVLDGHEVFVTTSIGIAVYPSSNGDSLLTDADSAMYCAKEQGRNTYRFHTPEMNAQVRERLNMESKLRRALDQEEFLLYYQPQVDLTTGMIVGTEALLRWQHPELGLVSPGKFIPVLEDIGMIVRVGEWVLQTACRQSKAWQRDGFPPLRMAVNISARQFSRRDLIDTVASVLTETGLDPNYLELEITESLLMEDIKANSRLLDELKTSVEGLRVSIDDFGTGYSSLSYLKTFPIDLLKIDQSFIRDITTNSDDAAITTTIIVLAHNLRLKVIAEGVETEEQMTYLREKGCDEAQGFYFSRPLPADEFTKLLVRGGSLLGVSC
jgi:diguanylate cyclase (GGDEF)-like protein